MLGLGTGLGAVAFRALIAVVHNLAYNGTFSFVYDANLIEDPSPFGVFLFFSPVIGGLIVVFLVEKFAPEAKGHGVPEVMDAIFYKRGNIRGLVAIVKSFARRSPSAPARRSDARDRSSRSALPSARPSAVSSGSRPGRR